MSILTFPGWYCYDLQYFLSVYSPVLPIFIFGLVSGMAALLRKNKRIYDGVEAETRKSQASFQIIQVSSEALLRMRLEKSQNEPEISLLRRLNTIIDYFSHPSQTILTLNRFQVLFRQPV